jgi:hypothetical protein
MVSRFPLKAVLARVILYGGALALLVAFSNVLPGTPEDDYQEECLNEGCSGEEVRELYASYQEECLHEGCSNEEIRELGGSDAGISAMFNDFKKRNWKIDPKHDIFFTCTHVETKTKCTLVFLWCKDECKFPDGSTGGPGWYICGGCIGWWW